MHPNGALPAYEFNFSDGVFSRFSAFFDIK
jgi:hypothetical protein